MPSAHQLYFTDDFNSSPILCRPLLLAALQVSPQIFTVYFFPRCPALHSRKAFFSPLQLKILVFCYLPNSDKVAAIHFVRAMVYTRFGSKQIKPVILPDQKKSATFKCPFITCNVLTEFAPVKLILAVEKSSLLLLQKLGKY
jgi:hypothetical protein